MIKIREEIKLRLKGNLEINKSRAFFFFQRINKTSSLVHQEENPHKVRNKRGG